MAEAVPVATLRELFPEQPSYCIRTALEDNGGRLDEAAGAIASGRYDHALDNALLQLQLLFPLHTRDQLVAALKEHLSPAAAADVLLRSLESPTGVHSSPPHAHEAHRVSVSASPPLSRPTSVPAPAQVESAPAPRVDPPDATHSLDPSTDRRADLPDGADLVVVGTEPAARPGLSRIMTQGDSDFATAAVQGILPRASSAEVCRIVRTITAAEPLGPVDMLHHMFPHATRDVLQRCLERTEGSIDEAAAAFMQMEEDEKMAVAAAAGDTEPEDEGDEGPADDDDVEDDPGDSHPRFYSRLGRGRAFGLGRGRAAPAPARATRVPSAPAITLEDKPAQSLLCMRTLALAESQLAMAVRGAGGAERGVQDHLAWVFRRMLQREQEHFKDYVVFYHSYSYAAILYEVQAAVARALYDLEPTFAPLPRLLKKPFDSSPALDILMAEFKRMSGQDHNPAFRAVAISVSNSLFGFGSEAPPISCFRGGYSCTDLSFRQALLNILTSCGLPAAMLTDVADNVVRVAKEFGMGGNYAPLPTERSSASGGGGRGRGHGRKFARYDPGPAHGYAPPLPNQGHMLQIFVHKDTVDHVAYQSHAMGVPVETTEPLSSFLRNADPRPDRRGGMGGLAAGVTAACNGQARVFMHPSVFTDPKRALLYHYCANDELMHDGPKSRAAFLQRLDQALSPIVGSVDGLHRAHLGVEGRDTA
eukprot:m.36148 g.36148  ORF g.36148 m.36148 type:complete len:704 (-) comp5375_c0_seq2:2188-4299(-)